MEIRRERNTREEVGSISEGGGRKEEKGKRKVEKEVKV